jgi:hypothetical protein
MAQFMLLLYARPGEHSQMSEDEWGAVVGKYRDWGRGLALEGTLVSRNKLREEGGRALVREGGQTLVTDGPFAEAKELLGGYFIVEASTYDEAVEIAKGCPHLEYRGRIELREIERLD